MKIKELLQREAVGAVLADSDGTIVRLWCLAPPQPQTLLALKIYFPYMSQRGEVIRLGGWSTLLAAIHEIVEAKMTSDSPWIQGLHLFDGGDGEGMATIKAAGLM